MANAKKCDRCGKLYEKYPVDLELPFSVQVNEQKIRHADLCIECNTAFQKFMKIEEPVINPHAGKPLTGWYINCCGAKYDCKPNKE